MKFAGIQIRRRFFVSIGLISAITGAWLYWSRSNLPGAAANASGQAPPFVRIAGAGQGGHDGVLADQAEYFDPTPLFLPTRRNFQQGTLPERVMKQPGQVFQDFDPKFNFVESSLPGYGIIDEPGSATMAGVLAKGNAAPFAGLGKADQPVSPLTRRRGYIEVKSLSNGSLSLEQALTDQDLPSVDYAVDFVVAAASAGLIGEPVMVASSGKDEIDGKLKDYLVNGYRLGERLAPGRYLVSVGP